MKHNFSIDAFLREIYYGVPATEGIGSVLALGTAIATVAGLVGSTTIGRYGTANTSRHASKSDKNPSKWCIAINAAKYGELFGHVVKAGDIAKSARSSGDDIDYTKIHESIHSEMEEARKLLHDDDNERICSFNGSHVKYIVQITEKNSWFKYGICSPSGQSRALRYFQTESQKSGLKPDETQFYEKMINAFESISGKNKYVILMPFQLFGPQDSPDSISEYREIAKRK